MIAIRPDQNRIDDYAAVIASGSYSTVYDSDGFWNPVVDYGIMESHPGLSKRCMEWNAASLDYDQIYRVGDPGDRDLKAEQKEGECAQNLLVYNVDKVSSQLQEMKTLLSQKLTAINTDRGQTRPFGEFDTGSGQATAPSLTSPMMTWHDNLYDYYFNKHTGHRGTASGDCDLSGKYRD